MTTISHRMLPTRGVYNPPRQFPPLSFFLSFLLQLIHQLRFDCFHPTHRVPRQKQSFRASTTDPRVYREYGFCLFSLFSSLLTWETARNRQPPIPAFLDRPFSSRVDEKSKFLSPFLLYFLSTLSSLLFLCFFTFSSSGTPLTYSSSTIDMVQETSSKRPSRLSSAGHRAPTKRSLVAG